MDNTLTLADRPTRVAISDERKAALGSFWGGYSGREMGGVEIGRFLISAILIYSALIYLLYFYRLCSFLESLLAYVRIRWFMPMCHLIVQG